MRKKLLAQAISLALVGWAGVGMAGTLSVTDTPNALLTIDQNRAVLVDRITATYGAGLAQAGISADQLRGMLQSLRADHLLAASLAGSINDLRDVLDNAASSSPMAKGSFAKGIGDLDKDLVYVP